jgi:hypothetical protein
VLSYRHAKACLNRLLPAWRGGWLAQRLVGIEIVAFHQSIPE